MPWHARKTGFYRTVVPQMTRWLPEAEAARWRLEFAREIERPEAAARARREAGTIVTA